MTRKMAVIGFSYLIGLFIASFFAFNINLHIGISAIIAGIALYFILRKHNKTAYSVAIVTLGIAFCVCGLYTHFVYDKIVSIDKSEPIYTEATVLDITYDSNGSTKYICKTKNFDNNFKFVLYPDDTTFDYETKICADLKFGEYSNNAYFASKEYYKSNGIYLYASIKNIKSKTANKNLIYYIKTYSDYVTDKINANLDSDSAAILNAMFTGDKTNYTAELKSQMYKCGIGHILAISGFHFSVLVGLLMLFLKRKNKYIVVPLLIVLCLLYCLFTGCTMSSLRAVIMIIIVYSGRLFNRKSDILNSLGIAAFLLTLFSPYAAKNVSLLLSLAGTFGIGVVGVSVNEYITKKRKIKKPSKLRLAFVGSYCAFLCTAPISIYVFNGISIVGTLLLIVITPICIVAMYFAFIYATLGCVITPLIKISGIAIKILLTLTGELSKLDFIYVYFTDTRYYYLLAILVVAVIAVYLITKNFTRTTLSVIISVFVIISASFVFKYTDKTHFKIAFLSDKTCGAVVVYDNETADIIVSGGNEYTVSNIKDFLLENDIGYVDGIVFTDMKAEKYSLYENLVKEYKVSKIDLPSDDYNDIIESGIFSGSYITTIKPIVFKTSKYYNINVEENSVKLFSNGFSMFIGNEPDYSYDVVVLSDAKAKAAGNYNADFMVANLKSADYDDEIINVYKSSRFILTVDNGGKITKRSYGYAFYG